MTMIRVTVGETVVTWSPEYGFTVAGGTADVEEIEPRAPMVPVPVLSQVELERIVAEHQAFPERHLSSVPDSGSADDEGPDIEQAPRPVRRRCGACGHPMHEPDLCTSTVVLSGTGNPRVACDCMTPFEETS